MKLCGSLRRHWVFYITLPSHWSCQACTCVRSIQTVLLRSKKPSRKQNKWDRCTVWPGDNAETVAHVCVADRVNMGLIPSCEDALHLGVAALRIDRGGWLHVHGNAPARSLSLG